MKQWRIIVPQQNTQTVRGKAIQFVAKEGNSVAYITDDQGESVACVGLGPGVIVVEVQA